VTTKFDRLRVKSVAYWYVQCGFCINEPRQGIMKTRNSYHLLWPKTKYKIHYISSFDHMLKTNVIMNIII